MNNQIHGKSKLGLFSIKPHMLSDKMVGNIGLFRSGKYIVAILSENDCHKFMASSTKEHSKL